MKDRSSDAGGRSKALRLQARGYHSPAGAPPTLAAPARASWAHAAATARGDTQLAYRAAPLRANQFSTAQAQATMHKFATTVLALALATTHGLL